MSLADLLVDPALPLCCGGGACEGHAAWCVPSPCYVVPALGEPVGLAMHAGRRPSQACGYCHAPAGETCMVTPLPGPVVDFAEERPVTVAGAAAGWR